MKKYILIIILLTTFSGSVFSMAAPCTAPANEQCGAATAIAIGGCTGAGSTGCDVTGDASPTSCGPVGTHSAWYSFVAPASGNVDVTLTLTGGFFTPIVVYSACPSTVATEVQCDYTGGNPLTASMTGLTPGNTYYVNMNSPGNSAAGDPQTTYSNICVVDAGGGCVPDCTNGIQDCNETGVDCGGPDCAPCGGAPDCLDNDDCGSPTALALNAPGGGNSCITDCNTGSNAGPVFVGPPICSDMPNGTVWFSITTDALTATLDILVTSGTMGANPEVTLFTNNCGPYTIVSCNEGAGGTAGATGISVSPSTTYLVAVSNWAGSAGTFDLCIAQDPDNSACNTTNSFVMNSSSMGSPSGGPYQMGEVVEFCYNLTDWQMFNCNYIGAFVPSFGDCWDPASFDAQGQPVNITVALNVNGVIQATGGPPGPQNPCAGTPSGSWQWFAAGTVTYNINGYYPAGTPMPAGWYFLSSYDPVTGQCNGNDPTDPDFSFGDGDYPTCGVNTFDYTICYSLIAGSDPTLTNCEVTMKTFADGEFGAWGDIGCTVDALATINGVLPVELISFTAKYNGTQVELNWLTESEINNDYFTIEKSKDGSIFEVVEIVKGAGNSNAVLSYDGKDINPYTGVSYYRLKQTDYDGKYEYSKMVSVYVKSNIADLNVFPNPVKGSGYLSFKADRDGDYNVTIYDVTGRKVISKNYMITAGENSLSLGTETLNSGMYFLTVGDGKESEKIKFIKE
jgi:Secretion system C-terminal sorting domain